MHELMKNKKIMNVLVKLEESVEGNNSAVRDFETAYVELINKARQNGASRMDIIKIIDKYIDKF